MRADRSNFSELLQSFHSELANILRLLDIAEGQEQIESNVAANDTLLQACLVLAVAQTEGYAKQLLGEFADTLNRSGVPLRRVAEPIRLLHTFQAIQELTTCDDASRGQRIRSLRQQLNVWWDDDRALRPSANGKQDGLISKRKVQRAVTSISSEHVTEVLGMIGCPRDICNETVDLVGTENLREVLEGVVSPSVSRESWEVGAATVDVGEKLSELVGKRNTIAHGNGKVLLSQRDILDALAFFSSFAGLLHSAVTQHLRETLTLG